MKDAQKIERYLLIFLTIMMTIRISSYFSYVPESVGLTRIIKIGLRLVTTAITIVMLFKFTAKHPNVRARFKMILPFSFYLLYLFLGICSLFWTTNVGFSLLQLSMTIETTVFSFLFYKLICYYNAAYDRPFSAFLPILNKAIFILCIIFIIGAFVDPDNFYRTTHGGTVARLGGLIINPNELGLLSLLGIGLSYIDLLVHGRAKYNIIAIGTCLAVLLMTQSRSSLFGFLVLSGVYLVLSKNYYLIIGATVVAFFVIPILIQTIVLKDGDMEEVTSFTGRKEFWGDLVNESFPKSPIYGYGFMSISPNTFYNKYQSEHSYAASMAHNTYIEVLINLGLMGAFVCVMQILLTVVAILLEKEWRVRLMAFFMLFPLMMNNVTEFGIFGHTNYAIMFYQFVFLLFTLEAFKKVSQRVKPVLQNELS